MHAADFVLPPSIMKQDDLSSQGRRWIRPNRREIRPPETPVADFKSVAEIPCPTACYVMGYVGESERIPNICAHPSPDIIAGLQARFAGPVIIAIYSFGTGQRYSLLSIYSPHLLMDLNTLASHQRLWKFYTKM
ncbi:hypothetical protein I7I51_08862 [Histoplasma capsulatum]|uniref:Uncharacterized protein n=1 Tax=Ajellomyces capsulatus TaxID=5037 RepID=A0A8A1M5F1_AJECA|nr:hypothetical protein I7I51_08862 [Histoplasma capsulatum]